MRLVEKPHAEEARSAREERRDTPVILSCLLVVGGIFTFVGALWLGVAEWDRLPAFAQLGILFALTGGVVTAGVTAGRRGYTRSGAALIVLATQLLWADGGFLLHALGVASEPGPWCVLATAVTAVTTTLAVRKRSAALVVLSLFCAAIAVATFGAATGDAGWLTVLIVTTGGLLLGGHAVESYGWPRFGRLLLALGTRAFLVTVLWGMKMGDVDFGAPWAMPGSVALAGALAIGLAVHRRSGPLGVLGALDLLVAGVLFGAATGPKGQLGVALALTGVTATAGVVLEGRGLGDQALLLHGLATQLLWLVGFFALRLESLEESTGGWCVVALGVTVATVAVSLWKRAPGLAALAVIPALVTAGTFGGTYGDPAWLACSLAGAVLAGVAGELVARRGRPEQGLVLVGAGTQLLWIAGLFALRLAAMNDRATGWCLVALAITLVTGGAALWKRAPELAGLAVIPALVTAGTFGTAYGDPAWLACCLAATALAALAGRLLEKRGDADAGLALLGLASILVWVDGFWILRLEAAVTTASGWTIVGTAGTLATFGLALARRSRAASLLGSLGALFTLGALGWVLRSGAPEGPAVWPLVMGLVLAALAAIGQRAAGTGVGAPPAVFAAVCGIVSATIGLEGFVENRGNAAFFGAWPYAVAAAAFALAWVARRAPTRTYAALGLATAALSIGATPTIEAMVKLGELAYQYATTLAGGALIVTAFRWPAPGATPEADEPARGLVAGRPARILAILLGLVHATLAPLVAALWKLGNKDGDALVREAIGLAPPELLGHPLFYLSYVVGTAVVLMGMGLVFARGAERKTPYRLLEVWGSLLFFILLSGLSLLRLEDMVYPAVLFLGGLVALAAGVVERHVLLVFIAGGFLSVNAWVQYFGKLHQVLPLGLLLIGFGVGVLASAILFERKIKPFLPEMKKWA